LLKGTRSIDRGDRLRASGLTGTRAIEGRVLRLAGASRHGGAHTLSLILRVIECRAQAMQSSEPRGVVCRHCSVR
jgi:hypothetical protein